MTKIKKRTCVLRLTALSVFLFCSALTYTPLIVFAQNDKPAATSEAMGPVAPKTTKLPATEAAIPQPPPKEIVVTPDVDKPKTDTHQAWWQAILVPVLSILGIFISALLASGLLKLCKLIEKKWNVDIPDSIEYMMAEKAKMLVGWAEEKAEKRLLYGDGQKTAGAQKTTEVVEMLEKFAESLGYGHQWQKDKIEQLVLGVLHLNRDKTIGSAGDRAKQLKTVTELQS